jgi:hypothetical protein
MPRTALAPSCRAPVTHSAQAAAARPASRSPTCSPCHPGPGRGPGCWSPRATTVRAARSRGLLSAETLAGYWAMGMSCWISPGPVAGSGPAVPARPRCAGVRRRGHRLARVRWAAGRGLLPLVVDRPPCGAGRRPRSWEGRRPAGPVRACPFTRPRPAPGLPADRDARVTGTRVLDDKRAGDPVVGSPGPCLLDHVGAVVGNVLADLPRDTGA